MTPGTIPPPYESTLHAACQQGHENIVVELINHGVDVNSGNGTSGGDALQAASRAGQESVDDLLLRSGSNVNVHGGRYGSALQAACAGMHESIVQKLRTNGALVNVTGGKYGTALQAASRIGDLDIVRVLLDNGADVNTECGQYGNHLQAACRGGHTEIVKMLLACGANVNAQGGRYINALRAASSGGYSDMSASYSIGMLCRIFESSPFDISAAAMYCTTISKSILYLHYCHYIDQPEGVLAATPAESEY
ncbi:ankyrin repeat domain-containing protein [Aspergillus lucknowensis]|uniref:Ankyrin repeat-containing domain protein n=1 Tax=Aspergillus lucknowensis TaxID=176173 RepID=A0ABR4LDY2_9EURO